MANYDKELRMGGDVRRKGRVECYGILELEYFSFLFIYFS